MERPTHIRLHVRHVYDAQRILEAVRTGALRLVTRRLNESERHEFIRCGAVFVWEESEDENGLRRWTDGKAFGQSRMRGDFLFYEEKPEGRPSPPRTPTTMWSSSVMRAEQGYPFSPAPDQDLNALVKQTYSAFFTPPGQTKQKKWHMTAYFTYAELQNLPTIDSDPKLSSIVVPKGLYRSGKARSRPSLERELSTPKTGPPPPQYQPWLSSASSPTTPLTSPPATCRQGSSYNFLPPPRQTLPSLYQLNLTLPKRPRSGSRDSEDQRVIHLLNSRSVL